MLRRAADATYGRMDVWNFFPAGTVFEKSKTFSLHRILYIYSLLLPIKLHPRRSDTVKDRHTDTRIKSHCTSILTSPSNSATRTYSCR